MAKFFLKRKPITSWLKKNKGISLSFIAKEKEIDVNSVYNFSKGIVRNPKVEKVLLKYGVPQKVIDQTFEDGIVSEEEEL